jgi:hypothetical protein
LRCMASHSIKLYASARADHTTVAAVAERLQLRDQ